MLLLTCDISDKSAVLTRVMGDKSATSDTGDESATSQK